MTVRGALALVLLSGIRTVGAEPCSPRAALDGDADAVARVTAELVRLGVTVVASPAAPATNRCPAVVAAVELDRGGGISVAVRDSSQRSEGRVVSDASIAAAWIDSWIRDDFEAPVFAPVSAAAPAGAPVHAAHVDEELAVEPPRGAADHYSLAATFEQAWTDDRSRWTGLSVASCVRIGGVCVGARGRYAEQDEAVGATAATRSDLSMLATASVSRTVGRMTIAPELGLGLGRLSTSRLDGCRIQPPCDPSTAMCMPPPPCGQNDPEIMNAIKIGDGFSRSTITPRASVALRIAIPLFEHVWFDAIGAITMAPFGHTDPYALPPGTLLPYPEPPDQLALPGEPRGAIQVGFGLRVGAP